MKIKEQTRKLAAGCSKHSFEVADKADVVWIWFSKSMKNLGLTEVFLFIWAILTRQPREQGLCQLNLLR